jgi:hypothetical protein
VLWSAALHGDPLQQQQHYLVARHFVVVRPLHRPQTGGMLASWAPNSSMLGAAPPWTTLLPVDAIQPRSRTFNMRLAWRARWKNCSPVHPLQRSCSSPALHKMEAHMDPKLQPEKSRPGSLPLPRSALWSPRRLRMAGSDGTASQHNTTGATRPENFCSAGC